MTLELLGETFSVCKVSDLDSACRALTQSPFSFLARTDEEISLVCPTNAVPTCTCAREDGWRAFRVPGPLDFSLIGILEELAHCLAQAGVSLFAVSTYNTDYVLVRETDLERAVSAFRQSGYLP